MMFPIGNQTVGIVTQAPVLDDSGVPVVNEFFETQTSPEVIWKTGCVFEIQLPSMFASEFERVTPSGATTKQIGMAFFPPDDDTTAIKSGDTLRYNNVDFQMRGDAVVEVDLQGAVDHVFCLCEAQA